MVRRQNEISKMLRNPSETYNDLMQNNPDFQKFVRENEHKPIEQIAAEYNLDLDYIRQFTR